MPEWRRLEERVAGLGPYDLFAPDELGMGYPGAAGRYLARSIEPGTPLAAGARLTMRGRIKVGRWLPFRARQILAPALGTVWQARVAGVVVGSDRYVDGDGGMDWRLLGLRRLVHAEGADVTRSSAERAAGESIWVPTALVRPASKWSQLDGYNIAVVVDTDGHEVALEHRLDNTGRIIASSFQRWGDPDNTGTWGLHRFGVDVTSYGSFDGVTIPTGGRAGWHHGTSRWDAGAFFDFTITSYHLLTQAKG